MTEHELVGWSHQCNGDEFEQALGVGTGQGSQSMGPQRVDYDCVTELN